MNSKEKAVIYKDIKEITASKEIYIPMIIVPLIFVIVIPTIMIIGTHFSYQGGKMINGMDTLIKKLPMEYSKLSLQQLIITVGVDYMFPSLFLLIPIMASSIIGASSFVGEKEHKTLETLLYTPITMEELFRAKLLGVFIPSYIVSVISFLAFGIVINIGGFLYFSKLIFPNLKWLILIFYLVPGITLLGLTFTVLVSAKSKSFQEAQQVSGFIVVPVILLIVGQATGLFLLTNIILISIGTAVFIIDYILLKKLSSRFVSEKLI
ncbi:ABC transporter permease subunit [Clostridium lundense]|uniref:ABC transporter permease subunit n=1 Tax=Clostridium lundense TaxID=319475 RepID=UPI0004896515|nr:ABC transporter permease subunit [Clostridium lundense]